MEKHLPTPNQQPKSRETLLEELCKPQPEVIVVSGGPCGGKSTLIEQISVAAEQTEQPVYIIPEAATNLAALGIDLGYLAQHDREAFMRWEHYILKTTQDAINAAKEELTGVNGVIICDRGMRDTLAYVEPHEAEQLAASLGTTVARVGYSEADKVLYLPSLAASDPVRYEELRTTNPSRHEDASTAAALDQHTLVQWQEHPELHIVDHELFEHKLQQGFDYCFAGSNEYEQKWAVTGYAATQWLEQKAAADDVLNCIDIVQTYHQENGLAYRLRRGVTASGYEFFHFALKTRQPNGNHEIRRTLTAEQYNELAEAPGMGLQKRRFVVRHANQLWHCDRLVHPQTGRVQWFFEAEASSPEALAQIEPPLPHAMHPVEFDTRQFAEAA